MPAREIVLCYPVRTAIGTFNGTLKATPVVDLGAAVVRETVRRSRLDAASIGSVVLGNVIQAGNRMNPARQAALKGGIPVAVPAMTVNRVCGSGAQAIVSAAQEIWLGHVDIAVAGGMENMDQAPYLVPGGRWGYRMGDGQLQDSMLLDGLNDAFSDQHSGWHTEDLVTKFGITREEQDRWAARSQQRFAAAQAAGKFKGEITAIELPGRKGPVIFDQDEHNRPDTTIESLVPAQAGLSQGRHHHGRKLARLEQRRRRDDRCGPEDRRTESPRGARAPGRVRSRRGRARHVRHRSGARGSASTGPRSLERG